MRFLLAIALNFMTLCDARRKFRRKRMFLEGTRYRIGTLREQRFSYSIALEPLMNRIGPIFVLSAWIAGGAAAQVSVTTAQYNNSRTNANLAEPFLNTGNVGPSSFGKLFSRTVDSSVYALPLAVSGIEIPGKGRRNVVYVATMGNTIYCFDSDNAAETAPLWTRNVGPALPSGGFIQPSWGILSTPVIDLATRTMYLVAYIGTNIDNVSLYLAAIDITTGADKFGPPSEILFPLRGELVKATLATIQRPALLLSNGVLYVAFANFRPDGVGANPDDPLPFNSQEGYVFAYAPSNLAAPFARFQVTPNGLKGGIWQAGRGLSADPEGYIYAATAGGSYDGVTDFGSSIVKLAPLTLQVVDWFTPANHEFLYHNNLDPSAGGTIVVPGTPYLIAGGKTGVVYLLNRGNMGRLETGASQPAQSFQATVGCGLTDCAQTLSTAFWNRATSSLLFVWDRGDVLRAFSFANSRFQPAAPAAGTVASVMSGGITVSSNGDAPGSGIVWAITASGDANTALVPATLRAFDATDVSRQLWNSDLNAGRDAVGSFTKFSAPVVANGRVFVITHSNVFHVYGTLAGAGAPPSLTCSATPNSLWPPNGQSVRVTVSGTVTPAALAVTPGGVMYWVVDEYQQVQPGGAASGNADGSYTLAVPLVAERKGQDKDGRTYTVVVTAKDAAGRSSACSTVVTVPHDQSGKKK